MKNDTLLECIALKQDVRIGEEKVNALRFIDNIIYYAETEDDLKIILVKINKILCNRYG